MTIIKTLLAVAIGVILGTFLSSRPVKADGGSVFVKPAHMDDYTSIRGTNVVGFSCVRSEKQDQCYIASQ